ncbi:MAG: MaoC family dehydratase N-terminal domain-containing protein [Chitinophagaceae bacterium]|nr:MaoC family dehydratase N-terminal domain-containing protein [Chitinophagaceae bacterium]
MSFTLNQSFRERFHVSEQTYEGFMQVFKDRNPLHTDEKFAQSKGFAGRVMHGNILNGFLSYFVGECLPVKNLIIHSQQLNYAQPVYLNDELLLEATVSAVSESVNTVEMKIRFTNADGGTVARGKLQIGILL